MKKTILLLLSFWVLVVSAQPEKVRVLIREPISDYNGHEVFARRAAAALEKAFRSEEFKQSVLQGDFKKTNGHSNQELYDLIMNAHEVEGQGGLDHVVDLQIRTLKFNGADADWKEKCDINSPSGTICIDGCEDGFIALCPQRLELWAKEDNVAELAGHYAHGYMHILGFAHHKSFMFGIFETKKWREKTFVYKIGNLVVDMIKKGKT